MAIRIVPAPTFRAQIPFTVAGSADPAYVDFEFRHKSPEQLALWLTTMGDRPAATALAEIVVTWHSGVIDEAGGDVLYSAAALKLFVESHGPRGQEMVRGYLTELTQSRQKNWLRLPGE